MTIKSDKWIAYKCIEDEMIYPYAYHTSLDDDGKKVISYGISSYGYDARLANEFEVVDDRYGEVECIDPKKFDHDSICEPFVCDEITIEPYGFVLARTFEYFKIPENVLVVCVGKSTYARCGLIVNVTPLEPGWEGHVTLELHNSTPLPIKIYANEGICQFLFFESDQRCNVSYKDRDGKYQGQTGVTFPKV